MAVVEMTHRLKDLKKKTQMQLMLDLWDDDNMKKGRVINYPLLNTSLWANAEKKTQTFILLSL